jgi:hypothetical protein
MIINNELINQLIRDGDSEQTFALHPAIGRLVDGNGQLLQLGDRIPMIDALRALIACGDTLQNGKIHPKEWTGLSFSKPVWQTVLLSLERGGPAQDDWVRPTPKVIDAETKNAVQAHAVARDVLLATQADPRFTMDKLVSLVAGSPNPAFTFSLLEESGEGNGGWISPSGALDPLIIDMPRTLPASRTVEVSCNILEVNDLNDVAWLEIMAWRDDYARNMLKHFPKRVELHFDSERIERHDLVAIQYHQHPVWLRASASCPTCPKFSKKGSLSLDAILMSRHALDQWHTSARQIPLPFDDDLDTPTD